MAAVCRKQVSLSGAVMKILFVYKSYYPETRGGVEEVLHVLMTGLVEKGHQCTLLVTTKNRNAYTRQEGNITIHYCPANITFASCPVSLNFMSKFKVLSREHDLINFHFPWPWADLTAILPGLDKPYIVTYQSDIVRQKYLNKLYKPLMRIFLSRAKAIVATSEQYRQSSTVLRRYLDKTAVIPLGLQQGIRLEECLQEQDLWKEKVGEGFFLFLGVLRYYKGLRYLLEAVKGTSLPIVIAGSGPEEATLKMLAEQYQLSNVTFVGAVNEQDKTALFSLCKAVVVPASERSEAYCLTLVEGLRAGKALISTELGTGTSFVNDAGITGLVVPAKNAQALRTALFDLEKNSDKCAEFSKAAKQRFLDHFKSDNMINAYEDLFGRNGKKYA
jgi:O-antigen biosynthesis rhamnosyltransferase